MSITLVWLILDILGFRNGFTFKNILSGAVFGKYDNFHLIETSYHSIGPKYSNIAGTVHKFRRNYYYILYMSILEYSRNQFDFEIEFLQFVLLL